jgi:hypothetical protein
MRASTICFAFLLVLVTMRATAQVDTVCATLDLETVKCNDEPTNGCSSSASLPDVIEDSPGTFGCMHPVGVQTLGTL